MDLESQQQHPQYKSDREIVNDLLTKTDTAYSLAELARLKIRYQGFPGAIDIQEDLEKVMQNWGLTLEKLFEKTREIHSKGQAYKGKNSVQEDWF